MGLIGKSENGPNIPENLRSSLEIDVMIFHSSLLSTLRPIKRLVSPAEREDSNVHMSSRPSETA